MRRGIEREVKLDVPRELEIPDLSDVQLGLVVNPLPLRRLHAEYWDTEDLRLVRAGVSLRYRSEGAEVRSGGKWTLKLPVADALSGDAPRFSHGPRGGMLSRRELDLDGSPAAVPEEAASLVRALARHSPLTPVARIDTLRIGLELTDDTGRRLAELDDDNVSVMDGWNVVHRFREVELEVAPHAPAALGQAVVDRLVGAGASEVEPQAKVARALGPAARRPQELDLLPLGDDATAGDLVGAALARSARRLIYYDPVVRIGEDPEGVHQARVATRRVRSDLRTFSGLVDPDWARPLRAELSWIGRLLGRVRDADVLIQRLWSHAVLLEPDDRDIAKGVLERLATERSHYRDELIAGMDSDRYVDLLDGLVEGARKPLLVDAASWRALVVAPALVSQAWRRLEGTVRKLGHEPDTSELHRVRINAKRCRYAAEVAALVVGKPALRFAKEMARLQDELGALQDAVVAEAWLRRSVEAPSQGSLPRNEALVVGELIATERYEALEARERWEKAWSGASQKGLRRWLS